METEKITITVKNRQQWMDEGTFNYLCQKFIDCFASKSLPTGEFIYQSKAKRFENVWSIIGKGDLKLARSMYKAIYGEDLNKGTARLYIQTMVGNRSITRVEHGVYQWSGSNETD